jgi:cobalt/nickel transport system ATP-binding protein
MVTEPLLSLREISFGYPCSRRVLDGVDLDLHPGERVAIVGENGAGKTTLLRLIVGLHRPAAGTIVAFGRERRREADFHDVRARAGLLFQDPDDQLFCPTVIEDIAFGPLNLGWSQRDALAIAERTLRSLGLDDFGHRITHKLSGGEKRLVSFAAVLAMQPDVLLLDEPTNALGTIAKARLLTLLEGLPQAILFVSHEAWLTSRLAHRSVVLEHGRLQNVHTHTHCHRHLHPHSDHSDGNTGAPSVIHAHRSDVL